MLSKIFKALKSSYKYKVAICSIVKDENPYLEEWINYHLKIGIEHFYIYDNESKIPVTSTLGSYVEQGIVTIISIEGKLQQLNAYKQCIKQYGVECNWIAFIDADEFIVPKNFGNNLYQFLSDYKKFGGVGMNWLVFGSNGHIEKQESQIRGYTMRSLKSNMQNRNYKSIVQPRFVKNGPIDPHRFSYKKGKYCVDENFNILDGIITNFHSSNKIQLNHYNLRSFEEFKEKIARGRADVDQLRNIEFFKDVDSYSNIIADEVIIELEVMLAEKAS